MPRKTTVDAGTRTLLVRTSESRYGGHGTFKITIPADAKVTFSGTNPQIPTHGSATLRIYKTENQQLAVFTDVIGFRDLSLPIERLVVTEEGSETWSSDEEGSTRTTSRKKRVKTVRDEVI